MKNKIKQLIDNCIDDLFLLEDEKLTTNPIRYPFKRDGMERISEQEAKQLFISQVVRSEIPYSVETPTKETYTFTGNYPLSAQIDLSLHPDERQINIEFKAHNVDKKNIIKDFEKLIAEGDSGFFFHVIKNQNSGTIPSITAKYVEGIENGLKRKKDESELTIILVCLEKKASYMADVDLRNFSKDKFQMRQV